MSGSRSGYAFGYHGWLMPRRAWFVLLAVAVAAVAWLPLWPLWRWQYGESFFERWKRPATAADRPNVWFDGTLSGPIEPVCAMRRDQSRPKASTLRTYLSSEDVEITRGGERWTVALSDLESSDGRAATKDELASRGLAPTRSLRTSRIGWCAAALATAFGSTPAWAPTERASCHASIVGLASSGRRVISPASWRGNGSGAP